MYKVILTPSKCPSIGCWIHKHKDGDVIEINDLQLKNHVKHGCMEVIEHYRIITESKEQCFECGQFIIKRKKIILR